MYCGTSCCRLLTLSIVSIAATMRYQRTAMLEVLQPSVHNDGASQGISRA